MVKRDIVGTRHTDSPFDARAADYDGWFDDKEGKIIFATEVKAVQEVLPMLPKPWLEIGVGSGRFAQALGISTGLDPASRLLDIAKGRGIITMQGKIEDRFLPAESFGAVFLIMTLCFIDNPVIALSEIKRALKPGGRIVLGVVPRHSPWGELYQRKKQDSHPLYKHANFYRCEELVSLLKDSGFVISATISTLFQKPGRVIKVENPLNGYHADAGFLVIAGTKTGSSF